MSLPEKSVSAHRNWPHEAGYLGLATLNCRSHAYWSPGHSRSSLWHIPCWTASRSTAHRFTTSLINSQNSSLVEQGAQAAWSCHEQREFSLALRDATVPVLSELTRAHEKLDFVLKKQGADGHRRFLLCPSRLGNGALGTLSPWPCLAPGTVSAPAEAVEGRVDGRSAGAAGKLPMGLEAISFWRSSIASSVDSLLAVFGSLGGVLEPACAGLTCLKGEASTSFTCSRACISSGETRCRCSRDSSYHFSTEICHSFSCDEASTLLAAEAVVHQIHMHNH